MAEILQSSLASLPTGEPTWVAPGAHDDEGDVEEAARTLAALDDDDRQICVLVYGLGLSLGSVSSVLRTDPAVISWRLRAVVCNADHPEGDARLEAAIAGLLAGRHPDVRTGPPEGVRSWRAQDLVDAFPVALQSQLDERLSTATREASRKSRSGLGIGVVVLLGLVVVAFTIYGAVLDRNPMLRGKDLVRRGLYAEAREAFQQLGSSAQAQEWIAIAWLAEGHFSKALGVLEDVSEAGDFSAFHPADEVLVSVDHDPETRALLPRGLIMDRRPTFLIRPGPAGSLTIEVDEASGSWPIPASTSDQDVVEVPFPKKWPDLPRGHIVWSVNGEDGSSDIAACTVISADQSKEINYDLVRNLPNEVPQAARVFLRGHYFLRAGLYQNAAIQFEWLADRFPGRIYPREMLEAIAAALGVDPQLLLR